MTKSFYFIIPGLVLLVQGRWGDTRPYFPSLPFFSENLGFFVERVWVLLGHALKLCSDLFVFSCVKLESKRFDIMEGCNSSYFLGYFVGKE